MSRAVRTALALVALFPAFGCQASSSRGANGDGPPPARGVGAWIVRDGRGLQGEPVEFGVDG